MDETSASFEATFKQMFRRHAAGVAIITVNYQDRPYGFTATSVASLSAQPPRFTFNMARSSSSWPAVANTTHVGVHMLGLENQDLADRFARTRNRFEGDHWEVGPHGVPVLKDVAGWLIGEVQMRLSFENNAVVVVQVVDGQVGGDGLPLLYHDGAYSQPAPLDYEI
ncbi:flavin oxidoreductase [Arthrobacter sp. ZBG10]|uniref:flavin reductase family protein n=2 Tax=Micrococcaceae TaxID=1268 RepID=UPI0006837390|nr:flavin reductase family protein [Arthrobacter sp. Leaf141]KNH20913.1 flavin oxidoreductase [Arthrobacter sp. ZBG10]KQR00762.1 flavin oxidoreductase [Arthrobacter sp. Leaf141]